MGYASKYYFVHKDYNEDYKKEPWYFGDMSREEAERLLEDTANPDGWVLFDNSKLLRALSGCAKLLVFEL